jgi:hypothetical protein
LFASLPKLADKAFVIGFLLPTLVAAMTLLYLLNDVEPFKSTYNHALAIKDFSELTIAAITIWAAATLLMIGNEWQYRVLEGYVGPFKRESWRNKFKMQMQAEREKLSHDENILKDPNAPSEAKLEHLAARRRFFQRFPIKPELVLPTRFGNVIRAFETYPYDIYRVEAIPAWLRLQGVVPKEFAALINDARSAVDFFVNIWFLGAMIAALALARVLVAIVLDCFWASCFRFDCLNFNWVKFLIVAAAAAAAVDIAYRGAIATAATWGDTVKSAFDLYLPALAKQLGYKLPDDAVERQMFWDQVSSLFLYRAPLEAGRWAASETEPSRNGGAGAAGMATGGTREPAPQKEGVDKGAEEDDPD